MLVSSSLARAMRADRCPFRPISPTAAALSTFALIAAPAAAQPSPFATRVIDYQPADGQFVDDPNFNNPFKALGAPVGLGTFDGDESKVVTLGGFGGSITLGFDRTIWNHPRNPMGLDFIVFGNAFWTGNNPRLKWAEAGVVEVSRDVNRNGRPDDPWYLIPGSHIVDPAHQQQNGHYLLPDDPFGSPPIFNPNTDGSELFLGYADGSPVLRLGDLDGDNIVDRPDLAPEWFYTRPDDPFTIGITPGSGGGDAFDIAWAINPATGQPARLPGIDFVRISTGAIGDLGPVGEVSVEIGGVAATRPVADVPGVPGSKVAPDDAMFWPQSSGLRHGEWRHRDLAALQGDDLLRRMTAPWLESIIGRNHRSSHVVFGLGLLGIAVPRPRRLRKGRVRAAPTLVALALSAGVVAAPPFILVDVRPGPEGAFDVMPDGRIIAIRGDEFFLESATGSGIYDFVGSLPPGSISTFGASFLAVSPDGSSIAVGDNNFGTGTVYTVESSDLNGGTLTPDAFPLENYDAAFLDETRLAVSYGNPSTFMGEIAVLDLLTGEATVVVTIDGASGGLAFDDSGNLLAGNGFDLLPGEGSDTGDVRFFAAEDIEAVLQGLADPMSFAEATLVTRRLTADDLDFDADGNLAIGGGDFFGGSGDFDYFAILLQRGIDFARARGRSAPPAWHFAADPEATSDDSLYTPRWNQATGEWLVAAQANAVIHVYRRRGMATRADGAVDPTRAEPWQP